MSHYIYCPNCRSVNFRELETKHTIRQYIVGQNGNLECIDQKEFTERKSILSCSNCLLVITPDKGMTIEEYLVMMNFPKKPKNSPRGKI